MGINIGYIIIVFVSYGNDFTPSVISISCNRLSILINNSNYIALKILDEVVGNVIIEDTANAIFVIVERNKSVTPPSFAEDLCSVESISVFNSVNSLTCSDTVGIVSIVDDSFIRLNEPL